MKKHRVKSTFFIRADIIKSKKDASVLARAFVMPYLSLDINYVRNYGERGGYILFKEDLQNQFDMNGLATVLVHPEWFVRSVGGSGLRKIPLTIFRKQMMNKIYDKFLFDYKKR